MESSLPLRILFILCLLLLQSPPAIHAGTVEGIVLSAAGPIADSTVFAYPDFAALAADRDAVPSEPGDKPGQFKLTLPPGRYFIVARGHENATAMYSYHGLNPILIGDEYRWLPFFAVPAEPADCSEGAPGISGVAQYRGQPLSSGTASIYSLEDDRFRGMGLLTNTLDDHGNFRFEVEPGTYVVIARQRQDAGSLGPLRPGDLFCFPAANPVTVETATNCRLTANCYPRDDLEEFLSTTTADPRGPREPRRRTASLRDTGMDDMNSQGVDAAAATSLVRGRVLDTGSRPRPSLFVAAYPASDLPLFQMHIIRLITTNMTRSDEDGRFSLSLPPGAYYLVAREKIGEAPDHGEYYGLYEGNSNHSIIVEPDRELAGIDIVVGQIMP